MSIIEDNISELKCLITKPVNDKVISLLKYNENTSDVVLHFDMESLPFKITTDFNKYCFAESLIDDLNFMPFNLAIIFREKNPQEILKELSKIINPTCDIPNVQTFNDPYHIFQKIDEFSKVEIDYNSLDQLFTKSLVGKQNLDTKKIPKELLLSQSQINQLLINEIKKVNRNRTFEHYVFPDPTHPYELIIRFKFTKDTEIDKVFKQINKKLGYDYMEIKFIIDPKTHPFLPPKLEYIKPQIRQPLLISLINLDILKLENWNSTITLDYLISNLGQQLEAVASQYIITESSTLSNELEYELIKLSSITKENSIEKVSINIPIPKMISVVANQETKYWKSGTGYGRDGTNNWDIKNYIKEQEVQIDELSNSLAKINKLINSSNMDCVTESVLFRYIINQVSGLNVLELEKNSKLYTQIFKILSNLIDKNLSQNIINRFSQSVKSLTEELQLLFTNSKESVTNEFLLEIYCTSDWYLSNYIEPVQEITISLDSKEIYTQTMKKLQFGTYQIPSDHRFITYKKQKPEQKSLMRILSEISSFKSGLPLNWESTIWVRIPKDSFNLFSFLISGPKDTPYENGLFEFHAYLPDNYPNTAPQVLLHTTGNGSVRFNPNLYDSGKVCLSLLGTWNGQEGEKWNAKTSTFLQVMVSIQSLILVEQPYFNEPGLEREMNSQAGIQKSNSYNEARQPSTIKLAMTNMINHPPIGFEDVVKNHFQMKKEEIINKTLIWQQSAKKFGNLIQANRKELVELLEKM